MDGFTEKLLVGIPLAVLGWMEIRVRGKVSHKTFEATVQPIQKQNDRIESHLWDLMQAQKITPSRDVPDEIKHNGENGVN